MDKTCPSVFTLVPAGVFKQLDTWVESASKDPEMELALYCEDESGWHPTSHSLYRFRPDREWFGTLKANWNKLVSASKRVSSLANTVGTAANVHWAQIVVPAIEAAALPVNEASKLSLALGTVSDPQEIGIETRYILAKLIAYLDAQRSSSEPGNGGLHPFIMDDGRLLWLCPEHIKLYTARR
jgi:hypothetical protein